MSSSRKSLVPQYRFSDDLETQLQELAENPLLLRMKQSRRGYSDPHRPRFHYVNPEGVLNDPNGLCYWRGNWHLFYQAYPPEDPRQHWGHAISKDLIHWHDLPYCIYPDPEECCFSGSTLVEDDRVIAMYHGTKAGNMIATSSDPLLLNWEKLENAPVIPIGKDGSAHQPYNVFDPCIWRKGDSYYSLSAGRESLEHTNKQVAADFLFRSQNLKDWEFLHSFIEGDRFTRVWDDGACPYFWPIGDRYILLFFSHTSGGQYLLGDYDKQLDKFVVSYGEKFNFGAAGPCGVHAPSAFPNEDGTVTVIFNMNPGLPAEGWNQVMTLPRVLRLAENRDSVDVSPVSALESLRENCTQLESFELPANQELVLDQVYGNSYELELEVDERPSSCFEINVLRSKDKREFTRISVFRERGYFNPSLGFGGRNSCISLDNSHSSVAPKFRSRPPENLDVFIDREEKLQLRIFVDRSVVEVFVNERRCVSVRAYPTCDDSTGISLLSKGSSSSVEKLKFWHLKSIYV